MLNNVPCVSHQLLRNCLKQRLCRHASVICVPCVSTMHISSALPETAPFCAAASFLRRLLEFGSLGFSWYAVCCSGCAVPVDITVKAVPSQATMTGFAIWPPSKLAGATSRLPPTRAGVRRFSRCIWLRPQAGSVVTRIWPTRRVLLDGRHSMDENGLC